MAKTARPKADPYRDLDVLDARAPRFNQAVIGTLALVASLFSMPWLYGLLALQLGLGLTLGRRWCLPCLFYFEVIQARFGEGRLEDSRPPRFANLVGLVFLTSATVFSYAGFDTVGLALGLVVAVLALLAATSGLCMGCELYKLSARFRGITHVKHEHIDPADLGQIAGEAVVEFTHPLCYDCQQWEEKLRAGNRQVFVIDVKNKPDLARKYGVAVVPTVVAIDASGSVLERLAP